ncbi:hypothetical protein WJX72_000769 [[Myrmecia] bisecta]|uniref:Cardiolipin synthase n=1 Tax=[Myrmecia] bisecta TaxID=41462 RepID=A0AAW1QNR0_9CHLO
MLEAGWTRDAVLTIPNALCVARMLSGPVVAALILKEAWGPAFALLTAAGISDWLDGYIARKLGQGSVLGSYLDPLADKVLVCSVVGALAYQGSLPMPLAALIIGRDVILPSETALWGIGGVVALTTLASGLGYARAYFAGQLLKARAH